MARGMQVFRARVRCSYGEEYESGHAEDSLVAEGAPSPDAMHFSGSVCKEKRRGVMR
jgi:hypothetical protein